MLATEDRTTDLNVRLETALKPLVIDRNKVILDGPSVIVPEQIAGGLSMAMHELTTNAIKYGALSSPDGRVDIKWKETAEGEAGHIVLTWEERGGPKIGLPKSEGFGTRLLRSAIPTGNVTIEFAPTGLVCRFKFPLVR